MPEFYSEQAEQYKARFDAFTGGYLYCLYFTETGPDNEASPGHKLDPKFLRECLRDCKDFQETNKELLEEACREGISMENCGHYFWLSRNGHGTGFWEQGLDGLGDHLHEMAEAYGTADPTFHRSSWRPRLSGMMREMNEDRVAHCDRERRLSLVDLMKRWKDDPGCSKRLHRSMVNRSSFW